MTIAINTICGADSDADGDTDGYDIQIYLNGLMEEYNKKAVDSGSTVLQNKGRTKTPSLIVQSLFFKQQETGEPASNLDL